MGNALALVGTFYPEYNYTGNVTTGMALGLSSLPQVSSVRIYAQKGAMLPTTGVFKETWKIKLVSSWKHDQLSSLLRTVRLLIKDANVVDAYLFNSYVTAYGRRNGPNAVGLLAPSLVSTLTGKPVFVYMHNFVETQDVAKLGYRPSLPLLVGARFLESLLLKTTTVSVPLTSQAETIKSRFGISPSTFFFPFLESYLAAKSMLLCGVPKHSKPPGPPRILLMGSWGPQKDLAGALRALETLVKEGMDFRVSVLGGKNVQFPSFELDFGAEQFPSLKGRVNFTGPIADGAMLEMIMDSDLLLLPYATTGGYSGVMNFASVTGIPMIAYDHPQLREQAVLIGADVKFVQPSVFVDAIRTALVHPEANRGAPRELVSERVTATEKSFVQFAHALRLGSLPR